MQWLMTSHVRRYHRHDSGSGHVWQGRFKAFPIQRDDHLLTVLRYIERNPLRAKLVRRPEAWRWSSLIERVHPTGELPLHAPPVELPANWSDLVRQPQTDAELAALRTSIQRGTPFGSDRWTRSAVKKLGPNSAICGRARS